MGLGAHITPVAEEAAAVQGVQERQAGLVVVALVQGAMAIQYPRLQVLLLHPVSRLTQPQQSGRPGCLQEAAVEEDLLMGLFQAAQRGQAGAVQAGAPMSTLAVLTHHRARTGRLAHQA